MKKFKSHLRIFIFCAVSVALLTLSLPVSGEYKFRDFREDHSRFERYSDEAENKLTVEEWQSILDSGREEMRASWERGADEEVRRYLLEGGDETEIRDDLEEARAEWERDFSAEESMAKGAWYLKREMLTSPVIDLLDLKERVTGANSDDSIETVEAWDAYVKGELHSVNSKWSEELNALLDGVRLKGEALTGKEKEGFERELALYEESLNSAFSLERDSVLYLARNKFITEKFTDTDSLRRISEAESAAAITESVIDEVESDIQQEEDRILSRSFSGDGSESINFSALGDDWEEELKKLIETGMSKWNSAREKLYNEMVSWKNSAQEAFDNIEAKWRLALEKLEKAKAEWEEKLRGEIYNGLAHWFESEEELDQNIDTARTDLDSYMENLSSQWSDHSSNLVEMAVNGSKVYSEALDNIKWLEEMCAKSEYANRGAFGLKGENRKSTDEFASILSADEKERIEEKLNSLPGFNTLQQNYFIPYSSYRTGRMRFRSCHTVEHETTCHENSMNGYLGRSYYNPGGYYTYEYLGSEEYKDENGNWALRERYEVKVYGKKVTYQAKYAGNRYYDYGWYESDAVVDSFEITNDVKSDYTDSETGELVKGSEDYEKSTYFYYKTELERWKNIRDSFSCIANDAEYYMHEINMLGENDGAGYLTPDSESENDPYLMTGAELDYELASRDREFWERRLEIAGAVRDYAYPENGERESAETTLENKEAAKSAMESAKTEYENALAQVETITDELKNIQGVRPTEGNPGDGSVEWNEYEKSIENLSRLYSDAGEKLKAAADELEARRKALIIVENGRDSSYIAEEIEELERNILAADRDLREKRSEYYSLLRENERAESAADFAALYSSAARGIEEAKDKLALITGDESDENLVLWCENIASSRTLVWGESSAADDNAADLLELAGKFNSATGEERENLRDKISSEIKSLYISFMTEYGIMNGLFAKLGSREFDPGEYLDSEFSGNGVYADYAAHSLNALNIIDAAFDHVEDSGSERSYEAVALYLQGILSGMSFVYGSDNTVYMEHYAALNILNERYRGLTPEAWEGSRDILDDEIDTAREIVDLHSDRRGFDISECESDAASGDPLSVILMREYYSPGSEMAGFLFMEELLGKAGIYITAEENIRAYVEENYSLFYKVRETVEETDYLAGMLEYININTAFISIVGEGVTLSVDDLKSLAPEQMSVAAGAASEYIDDLDKNGVPVPLYMRKMVQELTSMKSGLDASLFIADYMEGRFSETADEIYATAESEKKIHDSVADYLAYADELINESTLGLIDLAETLCSTYSSLSEDVRNYITEHGNEDVSNIAELVSSIENSLKGRVTALTDYNYITNHAGILPPDYADINGITGEAKTEFIQRLDPFYYRGGFDSWLADGGTGGVEAFISSRNLTGETAESVRIYALVKSYMSIEGSSYDSADPVLAEYVTERRLQDYIASHGRDDGEEDDEYIERIVSAFISENGGDGDALRDYMEGFLSGELTAAGGLPDDVKLFAARDFYYRSVHLAGGTLSDDDIEELLRERFGEDSLGSDIIKGVLEYAAGLRACLLYSGQDFDGYRENLDDYAVGIFTTAYYYGEAALLPMFDTGVYGSGYLAEAGVALAEGAISDALYAFNVNMGSAYNGVNEDLKVSEANFANAQALHDFTVSGEGGNCWRDYILPADIEVRDSDGNVTEVLVSHETYDETGSYYDEIDPETGERTGVRFDPDKIVMEGKDFSRSVVIEKANSMHDLFAALFAGAEFSALYAAGGTGEFLEEVDGIYNTGTDYSPGSGGFYSYEADLMNVVSKYTVLADDYASQVFDLESAISGLTGSVSGLTESLKSSRESYELMGGSKDELLKHYEDARIAHESVRAEYEEIGNNLADAQQYYSERNSAYIEQMNRVSSLYSTYQGAEFDYDRAYQVWEYANTPYLKNESMSDSGLSGGESVTGGTEDYGEIPVPDAMDVYNRIEARFNEADTEFKRLEEAMNNQETVEKLNQDEEYLRLKNELVNISGTYVRSAQVDAELEEKIAVYENDYINAVNAYAGTKESLNIFAEMLAKIENDSEPGSGEKAEQISELELIRDTILSHINTETERQNFVNGLAWYSCKTTWKSFYTEHPVDYKDDKQYQYRKIYADMYDSLPEQTRADIERLYEKFGGGDALTNILANYDNYAFSVHMEAYCNHRYHSYSRHKIRQRRKWRNRRNNYRGEANIFYGRYYSYYNSAAKTSVTLLENKAALINSSTIYNGATSVRYLSDIKEYLGGEAEKYNLTEEDLDHLYDAMSEGYVPDENSLNIEALRREKQRTDIDGLAVKAKIVNGRVVLLDKDGAELKLRDKDGNVLKAPEGNILTENYAVDDNSVILKDSEGNVVTEFTEGATFYFYDNNYDISRVVGALKTHTLERRNQCYAELMNYVERTTADGTHDYTIILRDLEATYHGMQETAVNFNSGNEYRQRGFEGYGTVTSEYVNNGTGESIQGLIVKEMMRQNLLFQEKLWAQQEEKFELRRERWEEVTGYILNRGTRDWRIKVNGFVNQWKKWRFDARREIEAGEKWWEDRDAEMKQEMKSWGEETSKASSQAVAEKLYSGLAGKIESYEKKIRKKMPEGINFNIDTDRILAETMKSIPPDSIDILSKSMFETDTTAGFAEMLNLGLSSSLYKYNEQKMDEYREAVGIMKNLQVIDIFNGIIEGFNKQLLEANENVYDAVDINLAKSENFAEAPFIRKEREHRWEIRVCVESNLTGNRYKTRRFTDYNYYINSTVFLQPIKGVGGTIIEFTNANTYANLDAEELDVYVGLEQEELSDRIDEVFGEDGLFSDYQEGEFTRLGDEFGKYYGQWMAGEALLGGMFYSKPMFPNGPNMLQTAAIAASLTGQPWAAILVAAATSGIQMADGTMTWKQAAFQVGVTAVTASIGVGADKLGSFAGAAGSFANVATKSATMTVGNTLLSGANLEGGSLGYDMERMTSMKTWTSAGISMAASVAGQQYCTNDFSRAVVSGAGSGLSQGVTTGDWEESMQTGLATSVGNYLGGKLNGAVTQMTGRDSFAVENFLNMGMRQMLGSGEKFSWDTIAENNAIENLVSKYVTEAFMSDEQLRESRASEKAAAEKRQQDSDKLDFLDSLETAVGGMFLSMRNDFTSTLKDAGDALDEIEDGLNIAAGAVAAFGERTGNLFTEGYFASDGEVAEIQAQERLKEAIRNGTALQEGSAAHLKVLEALYGQPGVKLNKTATGADIDSQARADEKYASYTNSRKIVSIKNFSQKGLDKRLDGHGACKFTDYMILAEARMRAEGQLTDDFDQDKIYDIVKNEGNKIIKDKFNVVDPNNLLRKAGVKGDISWGRETDSSTFNSTLIEQLDRGNPVMMILDDKHGEIIYGYEKSGDSLRYLVHDVGYQGDTYLNSKTWQPYQETFDGAFTSYKNGKPWKGYRTTTKLLYLK